MAAKKVIENRGYRKRQFMKTVGAAGVASMGGLSGCLGALNQNDDDDFWPPPRSTIDLLVSTGAGGVNDTIGRMWANTMEDHYPGDINIAPTNRTGAEGMIAMQDIHDSPPDGGTIGQILLDQLNTAHINLDDISQQDYNLLGANSVDFRSFMITHHARPVEDHFEWTWDDIVESALEDPLTIAYVVPDQGILPELLLRQDDRITEDDYNMVLMDGGSDVRAAQLAGDVDAYVAGFAGFFPTEMDEFGKIQFIYGDPSAMDDNLVETYRNLESGDGRVSGVPDNGWIVNQDGAPDSKHVAASTAVSGNMMILPPETPQEIIDIHVDAFEAAGEDEELAAQAGDLVGPVRATPMGAESLETILDNRLETIQGSQIYQELLEEYGG